MDIYFSPSPFEKLIYKTNDNTFIITDHRIRHYMPSSQISYTSLLLSNITSIQAEFRRKPLLLYFGVSFIVIGLIFGLLSYHQAVGPMGVVGLALLLVYVVTREKHMRFKTPTGEISYRIKGTSNQEWDKIINRMEHAMIKRQNQISMATPATSNEATT